MNTGVVKDLNADGGRAKMKRGLLGVLALMPLVALLALYFHGMEQGMLILAFFGFSVRGYLVSRDYLQTGDQEVYERQMKTVQSFTVALAFISFFWPMSMYQNAAIALCLVFHVMLERYVKQAK